MLHPRLFWIERCVVKKIWLENSIGCVILFWICCVFFMYLSHLKVQFIVWELGLQGCRVCFFRWECFYSYTITVGVCCTTFCLFKWCGLSIYMWGSSKIMPPQMSIEDHPNLWWSEHIWEFAFWFARVSTTILRLRFPLICVLFEQCHHCETQLVILSSDTPLTPPDNDMTIKHVDFSVAMLVFGVVIPRGYRLLMRYRSWQVQGNTRWIIH